MKRFGIMAAVLIGAMVVPAGVSRLGAAPRTTGPGISAVDVAVPASVRGRLVDVYVGQAWGYTRVQNGIVPVTGNVQFVERVRLDPLAASHTFFVPGQWTRIRPAFIGAVPVVASDLGTPSSGGPGRGMQVGVRMQRLAPEIDQEDAPN